MDFLTGRTNDLSTSKNTSAQKTTFMVSFITMINLMTILLFLLNWCQILICFIRAIFMSTIAQAIEITALRSQLSLFQEQVLNHKIPKPKPTPAFHQLWVVFSKLWPVWKTSLIIVKPETVIGWHCKAFKLYWLWKSKPRGRPKISQTTIALIKRIHKENPLWSPERIHDQLINLGITDAPAPNTIAKYFPAIRKPSAENVTIMEVFSCQSQNKHLGDGFLYCSYFVL